MSFRATLEEGTGAKILMLLSRVGGEAWIWNVKPRILGLGGSWGLATTYNWAYNAYLERGNLHEGT